MARGVLTEADIEALRKNKYVLHAETTRIIYSNEFKFHFIDEINKGKKPTEIFREAGFDIAALGYKRIERCAARWKESYAAGSLGNHDDWYIRKIYAENVTKKNRDTALEKIAGLLTRVEELEKKNVELKEKYLKTKKELEQFHSERLELKHLRHDNKILRAQVEALITIHVEERDKYNYIKHNSKNLYELAAYLIQKYDLDLGLRALAKVMYFDENQYRKYMKTKKENTEGEK